MSAKSPKVQACPEEISAICYELAYSHARYPSDVESIGHDGIPSAVWLCGQEYAVGNECQVSTS